jgi:hypothetical protein
MLRTSERALRTFPESEHRSVEHFIYTAASVALNFVEVSWAYGLQYVRGRLGCV